MLSVLSRSGECKRISRESASAKATARQPSPGGTVRQFVFGELLACQAVALGLGEGWWAWVDLNYRPHPYQGCALAT